MHQKGQDIKGLGKKDWISKDCIRKDYIRKDKGIGYDSQQWYEGRGKGKVGIIRGLTKW